MSSIWARKWRQLHLAPIKFVLRDIHSRTRRVDRRGCLRSLVRCEPKNCLQEKSKDTTDLVRIFVQLSAHVSDGMRPVTGTRQISESDVSLSFTILVQPHTSRTSRQLLVAFLSALTTRQTPKSRPCDLRTRHLAETASAKSSSF